MEKNAISHEEFQEMDQKVTDATFKKIKRAINALKWKAIKEDFFNEVADYGLDAYINASDEEIVKDFFLYLSENCV